MVQFDISGRRCLIEIVTIAVAGNLSETVCPTGVRPRRSLVSSGTQTQVTGRLRYTCSQSRNHAYS